MLPRKELQRKPSLAGNQILLYCIAFLQVFFLADKKEKLKKIRRFSLFLLFFDYVIVFTI